MTSFWSHTFFSIMRRCTTDPQLTSPSSLGISSVPHTKNVEPQHVPLEPPTKHQNMSERDKQSDRAESSRLATSNRTWSRACPFVPSAERPLLHVTSPSSSSPVVTSGLYQCCTFTMHTRWPWDDKLHFSWTRLRASLEFRRVHVIQHESRYRDARKHSQKRNAVAMSSTFLTHVVVFHLTLSEQQSAE